MGQRIGHFEIVGKDAIRLQKFYRDMFGWQISEPMASMGNYALIDGGSSGLGGGIGEEMGGGARVTIYVQVPDLHAALDKAASLGGKVLMPPMDVPGGPRIAMFADPEGNTTGLMQG
ncbi:MAG TPA: VOC family protein [Bacillota bacterium]|nr:VOC family protein [Bacillota bacterium]